MQVPELRFCGQWGIYLVKYWQIKLNVAVTAFVSLGLEVALYCAYTNSNMSFENLLSCYSAATLAHHSTIQDCAP